MSTLDNLRKAARRWLKALRANDARARARLNRAYPNAPAEPSLRDIQYALAREHGFSGWTALRDAVAHHAFVPHAPDNPEHAQRVAWFLEQACPDWRVGGRSEHALRRYAAERILKRHPEVARANIYTAVVCGDLEEVERLLTERPEAASEKGGPREWPPLLYLCCARLSFAAADDNAVAIARALLDRGADPNAYYPGGSPDIHYTALTAVVGDGEEDAPPHPQAEALFQLLLERGAEPYDIQVLYNTHFHGNVLWFLKLIHAQAVKLGRQAAWDVPNWSMLDMGGYGPGAYYLLKIAVEKNNIPLAEWLLAHGASPNATSSHPKFSPKYSLHEEAVRREFTEMADLLVRFGATRSVVTFQGVEAFAAACLRLDRDAARALLARHPEYLRSPLAMFAAAKQDRADVVALLLDLGMSPDVQDHQGQRPLHVAASHDSARVAELLIERGAEIEPVESNWGNTPLGFAIYGQVTRMIELLGRVSRDVFRLTYIGNVERLREVLSAEAGLAKIVADQSTPLMWLPDDEGRALEIVTLLLAHGADPAIRNGQGKTAADIAERRGLFDIARVLRAASSSPAPNLRTYEEMAEDLLEAYQSGDSGAMQRVWDHAGHRRSWETMRTYVQLDLGKRPDSTNQTVDISLADAQFLVARGHGFESWPALAEYVTALPSGKTTIAAKPVKLFSINAKGAEEEAASARDWDTIIGLMKEQRIPGLNAEGQMMDALLERISRLEHITSLNLNGSKELTDDGLRHLARLPRLQHLHLMCQQITDRGLEVLRHLPELRTVTLSWSGVTDAGVAHLGQCQHLERVDLSATRTGDGAVRALTGKRRLRHFRSGNGVTDAGLRLFHQFPVFKTWQGGEISMALLDFEAEPNYLWLRGSFTDTGIADLMGLDGLFALNLDDSRLAVTAAGLEPLVDLPNLGWLAFDATDEAMPYISAMRRLRFLMCQDTGASDEGFVALSRSQSIEYIWGRRCYNLRARGFAALAAMPALRALSVSCKNVDDAGLAALPSFPALRELMPMDVPDDGYRHVGRCEQLESLVLMYCRDTTDIATEHIAGLRKLKHYFASYTKITDRSLQILGRMPSLERVSLSACAGITNAGVAALAGLPQLREVNLGGLRNVTPEAAALFPADVRVKMSM
jgi:ankyrin repeat protein